MVQPFYSWMGGKRKLLPYYRKAIGDVSSFSTFVEPFFGGGSAYFGLCEGYTGNVVLNDLSPHIYSLLSAVKEDAEGFCDRVEDLMCEWGFNMRGKDNNPDTFKKRYYALRDDFLMAPTPEKFYVLHSGSFSHLYIINKFGRYMPTAGPMSFGINRKNILECGKMLMSDNVTISCDSYHNTVFNPEGALVFCDPPYLETTGYNSCFDAEEYKLFGEWCLGLKNAGSHILIAGEGSYKEFLIDECLKGKGEVYSYDYKHYKGRFGPIKNKKEILVEL